MSKQKKETTRYTNSTVVQVLNPNTSDVKSAYASNNSIKSEFNSSISNNNNYQISSDGSTVSSASNNSNFRNQSGGTTPNSFRNNNQDKSNPSRNYRSSRGGATMNQVSYRPNSDNNHQQTKKQKYILQDHFSPNRRIQHFLLSHWKNFIHQYHIKEQKSNGWKRINSPDHHNQISNNSSMSTSFDSNLSSPLTPDMTTSNASRSNSNSTNAKRSTPTLNNSPPNFTYHPSHQQHIKKAASPMQNSQAAIAQHNNSNWNSNNVNGSVVNGSVNKKTFIPHNGQTNGEKQTKKNSHNQNTPPNSKNNSFDHSHSTNSPLHNTLSTEPKVPSLCSSPTGLSTNSNKNGPSRNTQLNKPTATTTDPRPLNEAKVNSAPINREKKSLDDMASSQKVDQTLTILSRNNRDENRHSESCASTNKSQCSILNGVTNACSSANKTRHQSASSTSLTALSSGGASIDRGDTPNTIEQYYTPEPPSSPSTNPGANSPE